VYYEFQKNLLLSAKKGFISVQEMIKLYITIAVQILSSTILY